MKISMNPRRNLALALGALALLGGSVATGPAYAQAAGAPAAGATTAGGDKIVSLNLINVPIQTALNTLFKGAGVNSVISPQVQGFVNINVSDVPLSLALRQMLGSLNPPATFTVDSGVYNVSLIPQAPPPAPTFVPTQTPQPTYNAGPVDTSNATADALKGYVPININKYDAYYIASLIGGVGIVPVGINDVIPATMNGGGNSANGSAFGGNNRGGQNGNNAFGGRGGQNGGFGGQNGGFGGRGGGQGGGFGGQGGGQGGRGGGGRRGGGG